MQRKNDDDESLLQSIRTLFKQLPFTTGSVGEEISLDSFQGSPRQSGDSWHCAL